MLKACSTTGAHRSLRTPDGEHCHRGGADPHRSALNCRRPTRLRSRVSGSSIELRGIEPGHRISTKNKDRDEKPAFQSTVRTVGTVRSEEHTSELQSLMRISYAVFCLKKKTKINHH